MVSYAFSTRTYDNLHKTKLVLLKQMVNNYMRLFLMNGGKTARAIARMAMNARSSVTAYLEVENYRCHRRF